MRSVRGQRQPGAMGARRGGGRGKRAFPRHDWVCEPLLSAYKERGIPGGRPTLNTDVDVILLITSVGFPSVVVGLRERVEGLEILDVCGHEIDVSALPVVRRVSWDGAAMERRSGEKCVRRGSSVRRRG